MLLYILLTFFILFSYLLVIKPLIPMIKLKMQFGNACFLEYHFLGGELWAAIKEMKTSKDLFKRFRDLYLKHKYKIAVSNFLWNVRLTVADPEYYRIMLQEPKYYSKVNIINHK